MSSARVTIAVVVVVTGAVKMSPTAAANSREERRDPEQNKTSNS